MYKLWKHVRFISIFKKYRFSNYGNNQFSLTPEEYYILANTVFEEKDYENSIKYYTEYLKHVIEDF